MHNNEDDFTVLPDGTVRTKSGRSVAKERILTFGRDLDELREFEKRGYYNQFY